MATATFKGVTLAESDSVVVVEGNLYFPPEALAREHFVPSDTHTTCPWKGEADYYSVRTGDGVLEDGAWFYPSPKPAADEIRGHVAFGPQVDVER